MKINRDKTQLMFVKPDKELRKRKLKIGDCKISHQPAIKTLRVTISEDLGFDEHIFKGKQNVLKSITVKTVLLRLVRPFISKKALGNIASSLINSTILYAAPVWGRTTKANIQKIQAGQTKAARIVDGKKWKMGKKSHRQTMLNDLDWPNTQQIITTATLNV